MKFETRDAHGKSTFFAEVALTLAFCLLIVLSGWFFKDRIATQMRKSLSFTIPDEDRGPRPGAWTSENLQTYRADQKKRLSIYAWTNPSHSVAVIPLERAIDLAVEKKLLLKPGEARNAP